MTDVIIISKAVPNHDPAGQNVEAAIREVLEMSKAAEIHGKDVTPFILRAVAEKTAGDSLRRQVHFCVEGVDLLSFVLFPNLFLIFSNISLVKQNAEVGADIATCLSELQSQGGKSTRIVLSSRRRLPTSTQSRVVCVGGTVVDIVAKASPFITGTSNPGVIHRSGMICIKQYFI